MQLPPPGTSARPDEAHAPSPQLPEPRRVLGWLYLGRLLLLWALLLFSFLAPQGTALAELNAWMLVVPVVVVTMLAYGVSHRHLAPPGETFLYLQLLFDVLVVTLVVQLTGGPESDFAALYLLLFCASALLLPLRGTVLIGGFAIVLYLGSLIFVTGAPIGAAVFLKLALFAGVALVTGYLGERVRAAGAALGQVEIELRQLRLDTGDILNTVSTGVLTVDEAGKLAYLNPAAEEILALSSHEWIGRPVLEELDRIAPGLGAVIERSARERIGVRRFETEPLEDDTFVLGVSTTLVERSSGQRPAVTAIFQDITEKMRVEALRRRAERLEAVAELSASLAHEIKNPLASIRSAVEQLAGGGVDEEDAAVLRNLAVRESDRLSRLLAEFIDFARVKLTAPQPVELPSLVQHVVELVRAHPDARGREIRFRIAPEARQARIRGAEDLMHRAVLNLVLNAAQWAGEGGRVELALEEERSDLLSPSQGALQLVRLTVTDTGPGVDESIVEHIFDPFFTRRPGGTGLGLALVQRAVEAHGGAVFVDNAPAGSGLGATFTLYLPMLPTADETVPVAPSGEESTFR